jgi:hypothetical protein
MNLKATNSSMLSFTDTLLLKAKFIVGIAISLGLHSFSQGKTLKDSLIPAYYLQKTITTKNLFL